MVTSRGGRSPRTRHLFDDLAGLQVGGGGGGGSSVDESRRTTCASSPGGDVLRRGPRSCRPRASTWTMTPCRGASPSTRKLPSASGRGRVLGPIRLGDQDRRAPAIGVSVGWRSDPPCDPRAFGGLERCTRSGSSSRSAFRSSSAGSKTSDEAAEAAASSKPCPSRLVDRCVLHGAVGVDLEQRG